DLTFGGGIAFYNLISDNDQPRPGNLIKRINNADSVVTLVEDERDGSGYGSVVYKLVVTNAMLGIDETQDDGTAETGEDTNTSEPEPEDDDETSSAGTDESNEGENENE
ncbi:MAG: hypothetical protein LBJ35_01915, partial [Spirochaetaceae bacterium]|nr:hypothetical protein [Spirochaetaceae bacterium]